jgi:hypothetical protein
MRLWSTRSEHPHAIGTLVFIMALGVALLSARHYAGSWNDGSRLAATESLVDYHTFAIDRSIFVHVPQEPSASPYGTDTLLNRFGTRDVVLIGGKLYSGKAPVPSVLMAALYAGAQRSFGINARQSPSLFCYLMTVITSGIAYAIAVWCIFRIGVRVGLDWNDALLIAASFAFATVAIAYMQAVNNHIVLLAIVSAVILNMLRFIAAQRAGKSTAAMLLAIGALSGLGYSVDQGSGMILLVAAAGWAAYRTRSYRVFCLFALAAAPWVVAHHLLIFAIGHSLRPLGSIRAYESFPGAAFTTADMTGIWHHRSVLKTIEYGLAVLFGRRGFIFYNLALYLSLVAICQLIAGSDEQLPELIFAAFYAGGTWIMYSLLSNNYSGVCCSIRWFVPLLASGYYVLIRFLKQQPEYWPDFMILSGWGVLLGARIWWQGPWVAQFGFFYYPLQAAALLSWAAYRVTRFGQLESLADGTRPT